MLELLTADKRVLPRQEVFNVAPDPDPKQEDWNRFRLSIIIATAMPMAQFLVAGTPMPHHELATDCLMQSLLVRILSFLDDEFESYLNANPLPLPRRPRLAHRIDAISSAGLISNAATLHLLRHNRNDISHMTSPPQAGFQDVLNAADEVESSLSELGVLRRAPRYEVSGLEFVSEGSELLDGELLRRMLRIRISAGGVPFCEFEWPYIYSKGTKS